MKHIMWITLLLGVWLIVAPFSMGASATVATNDFVVGILLVATSAWILAIDTPPAGAAWFDVLCGMWLIASPFVLGYRAMRASAGNDIVAGVIAIIVSGIAAMALTRRPTVA